VRHVIPLQRQPAVDLQDPDWAVLDGMDVDNPQRSRRGFHDLEQGCIGISDDKEFLVGEDAGLYVSLLGLHSVE
jgi:hypothetical protein